MTAVTSREIQALVRDVDDAIGALVKDAFSSSQAARKLLWSVLFRLEDIQTHLAERPLEPVAAKEPERAAVDEIVVEEKPPLDWDTLREQAGQAAARVKAITAGEG